MDSYQCPLCNNIFDSDILLKMHLAKKNECDGKKIIFACDRCRREFISNAHLKRHQSGKRQCKLSDEHKLEALKTEWQKEVEERVKNEVHINIQKNMEAIVKKKDDECDLLKYRIAMIERKLMGSNLSTINNDSDYNCNYETATNCTDTTDTTNTTNTSRMSNLSHLSHVSRVSQCTCTNSCHTSHNTHINTSCNAKNICIDNSKVNNRTMSNAMNTTYLIHHVTNNYPDVKNFEDCVRTENVTDEMVNECKKKYFIDGAAYLIEHLCGTDVESRPLHCTDVSRNNYIYKTNNSWKIDAGGEEIKAKIIPVIDSVYNRVHNERIAENPLQFKYIKDKCIEMNSRNVKKICSKALKNMKSNYIARNMVDA